MYHIKVIWTFLRENWKIPFLLLWTLFIWTWSRRKGEAAIEILNAKKESYDKQIVKLKENHNKELSLRDEEIKQYHEVIEQIEKKYKKQSDKISKENKIRVKQIVKESKGHPDEVKEKIEKLFNFSDLD